MVRVAAPVAHQPSADRVVPAVRAAPADLRAGRAAGLVTSADRAGQATADQEDPAGQATADQEDPAGQATADQEDPAGQATADRVDPAIEDQADRATSEDPTTTIGDHTGTQEITTGAADSMVPLGVTGYLHGAGAHRRRRRGTGRCRPSGGPRHHGSTTGATTSNRSGIPVTANGDSISSGSGYRSRSDLRLDGRLVYAEAAVRPGQIA